MKCKVCSSTTEFFAGARILGRHEVSYHRCAGCGFVRTEEPFWLEDAYADAITGSDVGLVRRNLRLAKTAAAVISTFFDSKGRFLDYGGGYGLLVRLLRDAGLDFHHLDRHCENIFARGFEARPEEGGGYELLTAFELFEHLPDPAAELGSMLNLSRNILFTTTLLPDPPPPPDAWWYYGLEHGQHVSFYTLKSLQRLAERFSLHLYSDGATRHLLTERRIPPLLFRAVSRYRVALLLEMLNRRRPLTDDDYRRVSGEDAPGVEG